MQQTVTLEEITEANFEAVMEMELPEHQRDLLASNAYSIAQSKFYPDFIPRAIHHDGKLAGFLLYDRQADDEPGHYGIYRFMIDYPLQSKGIGRRAMELVLAEIKAQPDAKRITICYHSRNELAKTFYQSFGFQEVGPDESGEMIAEIILS
ncbi:GNAT family N-acetyltransferase [Oxalobacteraceae bacterium]|nr:GNAT family N-acetyltransferase [Oxalobacteraceae bacterium]